MNVLSNILLFLAFLQSIAGFSLMAASTMRFREPVKKRITAALLTMLFFICVFTVALLVWGVAAVQDYSIVVILVSLSAWYIICSGDPFFVSLFHLLSFVNIYIFISYLSNRLSINWSDAAYMASYLICRTVINGAIILLLFKFVRSRVRRLVDILGKEWRAAALVPLLFLILQTISLYYPNPFWYWDSSNWYNIIIFTVYALFLAVYYLLYIQASSIVEKYMLEERELLMAQQEKLWESELARYKADAASALQQRHDMHHHNAVIMGLLQRGDTTELNAYLTSYDTALDSHNTTSFCLNPIADSILNVYAKKAAAEGIKLESHISLPEDIGIDNIDLTCVLGNALENALEGCLRLPEDVEREIIVTAKFIDKRFRFQVENTCPTNIVFEGELPFTQKQGGGMGTKSILYTAERYDGTAGFSVMDGRFTTQIVLNAN